MEGNILEKDNLIWINELKEKFGSFQKGIYRFMEEKECLTIGEETRSKFSNSYKQWY